MREKFSDLPAVAVSRMTDGVFEAIAEALAEGRKAEIRKFGTFFAIDLKRRLLRSPATGDVVEVPARRLPRFRPSRRLRGKANGGG
ncbi:MAG: integration host factor subunit beta [Betaproteobacteria bacterium]|nr:integration host factor subunit beta [Betaproteobacteria bacterium]